MRILFFVFLLISGSVFSSPDTLSPRQGLILINEVLFNPRADGVDFVELYNNSENYIDLSDCYLSNWDQEKNELAKIKKITVKIVFPPKSYLALTKDSLNIFLEYPQAFRQRVTQIKDLPAFNNDKGSVLLLDAAKNILDRFDYQESMHFSLIDEVKGISLERLYFDAPTNDPNNWHSAASSLSATPGYENSQHQSIQKKNSVFELEKEVFTPDQDGFEDVLTIHFAFEKNGYVSRVFIYDLKGRRKKILLNNELLPLQGIMTWDGLDDAGILCSTGMYLLYFEAFHPEGETIQIKKACA